MIPKLQMQKLKRLISLWQGLKTWKMFQRKVQFQVFVTFSFSILLILSVKLFLSSSRILLTDVMFAGSSIAVFHSCRHENSCKHGNRAWGTPSKLYTVSIFSLCLTLRMLEELQSTILNSVHQGDLSSFYCCQTLSFNYLFSFFQK